MSLVGRNRKVRRRDIQRILWTSVGGLLASSTLVAAHSFTLVRDSLRNEQCLEIALGQNTRVFDRNQHLLTTIASEQNREPVALKQMPKNLINATLSIEDKGFYDHGGLDYERIGGAFVNEIGSGGDGRRQGGSTITMQLMKNLCHPEEDRTYSNKLSEAYFADQYEKKHSKDAILQRYLNSVFLGNNAVGVEAASQIYFDRPVTKITLPQAALLAGLLQAPSTYDPFKNKKDATARRNLVLSEMAKDGHITEEQATKAKKAGLQLKRGSAYKTKIEGYFVDYVENHLQKSLGRDRLRNGGYRAYTTINPRLQVAARKAMRDVLASEYGEGGPSAALVMIDAKTGHILTMASTQAYKQDDRIGEFNLAAEGLRQAGSTYKTFVLTAALEKGYSPNMTYYSVSPISISGSTCADPGVGPATVSTFSRSSGGARSLISATTSSDNSVYAQLTCDIGPQAVFDEAKKMGISSQDDTDRHNISLGLGGLKYGVSVLEMARAYAPLANGGYRVDLLPITRLSQAGGKSRVFKPKRTKIMSDGVAAKVTEILRANVTGGTGGRANLSNVPVAGKTGTTDSATDVWFVGYTPKYVTAVWVGYPETRASLGNQQGGRAPATIWGEFMKVATAGESGQSFLTPEEPFVSSVSSTYWTGRGASMAKPKEPEPSTDTSPDADTEPATPTAPDAAAGTGGTAEPTDPAPTTTP